jgi:hypothetical protein
MLDYGDDPEVFERDHCGDIRQVDSASDADGILASFRGALALMRFRLVFDGRLPAAGNKHSRAPEKWTIRRALHPQLLGLWATHPTLKGRAIYIPNARMGWMEVGVHDSLGIVRDVINEPIVVGGRSFIPLVRKSLALTCELDILFLRNDAPGSVVKSSGGDLDNRIKTLFDGLRLPLASDMELAAQDDPEPFYCLLEDDALISSFTVRTDRLLLAPGEPEDRVLLVMEAKITATKLTAENLAYLTD